MGVRDDVHVERERLGASGRVVDARCGDNGVAGREVLDGQIADLGVPRRALVQLVDAVRRGMAAQRGQRHHNAQKHSGLLNKKAVLPERRESKFCSQDYNNGAMSLQQANAVLHDDAAMRLFAFEKCRDYIASWSEIELPDFRAVPIRFVGFRDDDHR